MILKHKHALVTGASRGIGRVIAGTLAAEGARVAVHYGTNERLAHEVVEEITAAGGSAFAVGADLRRPEEVHGLFDAVLAEFGRLDVLVNNAGLAHHGPIGSYDERVFADMVAVNVTAPFLAMRLAARHLSDGGRIITLSSALTRSALADHGVYAATKAAAEQLGFALSKELGARGITVNNVLPGPTETDEFTDDLRAQLAPVVGQTPLGRFGQARDIADVVAFLASDRARWVTGQSVVASGGLV
ncbi:MULTISPECIES: SDR family oxidoreductase [unclassified Saccharothrix]|uniref:SDR family oxidoreductase n=1 Tax=unclassified Saccharothrix TaxID=2593673 RepID=UPI00307F3009